MTCCSRLPGLIPLVRLIGSCRRPESLGLGLGLGFGLGLGLGVGVRVRTSSETLASMETEARNCSPVITRVPASPLQAQAVAELQESLNIVELNALARDPDLIASVQGLEQLMDSTTTTTTTMDSEQLLRMAA